VARISRTYLPIKAVISFFMDACDRAQLILPKMQEQDSLTLCWRSFSGCGWVREYAWFAHQGGKYVENETWRTNVNIVRLPVAYLNASKNVWPETQNQRLEPTGLTQPGATRGVMCTCPDVARQESVGRVFRRVWNRSDTFLQSKAGQLAGYPDLLLTQP
jgi:hypothetical protein